MDACKHPFTDEVVITVSRQEALEIGQAWLLWAIQQGSGAVEAARLIAVAQQSTAEEIGHA
jgi:hypothetical protein